MVLEIRVLPVRVRLFRCHTAKSSGLPKPGSTAIFLVSKIFRCIKTRGAGNDLGWLLPPPFRPHMSYSLNLYGGLHGAASIDLTKRDTRS